MSDEGNQKTIWITGAGSGIGAATARWAASEGWHVAVSGRRVDKLNSTAETIQAHGGRAQVLPLDVADREAVAIGRDHLLARTGRIDALVLAAGVNTTRRLWADQDLAEFDCVVRTNLLGTANVIDAALPHLRKRGGTTVVVSSYSSYTFTPIAGVAYSASKSALAQLTRTLNAQEAQSGVRACLLCPGRVTTDFLSHRLDPPSEEDRAAMLTPEDVARTIRFILDAPAHVCIDELVVSPISQT